jgi:hypothetical protein
LLDKDFIVRQVAALIREEIMIQTSECLRLFLRIDPRWRLLLACLTAMVITGSASGIAHSQAVPRRVQMQQRTRPVQVQPAPPAATQQQLEALPEKIADETVERLEYRGWRQKKREEEWRPIVRSADDIRFYLIRLSEKTETLRKEIQTLMDAIPPGIRPSESIKPHLSALNMSMKILLEEFDRLKERLEPKAATQNSHSRR